MITFFSEGIFPSSAILVFVPTLKVSDQLGALVAQFVKPLPTDLAVPGLSLT